MLPILIEGPAVEPVTLSEARAWLRLDGPEEDDLVRALAVAARLTVEAEARRLLVDQTWRIVLDLWPESGRLALPLSPVRAVLAARVFDAQGGASPLAPGAVSLVPASDPPCLTLAGPLLQPGRNEAGIEIDLLAGYGPDAASVPEPMRLAIRLLVARWFENRGDARIPGEPVPEEIARLLRPYRRTRI